MTNIVSTLWTCQGCGGAFISTPPDSGLCDECLRDSLCTCARPQTLTACPDALNTCAECGGPVCPDCGQRLLLLVPVAEYINLASSQEANSNVT
jgi:hypothetical protein